MGLFRPERLVTGHDGREWEIYISKLTSPGWRPLRRPARIVAIPLFLFTDVVWPLIRFVVLLPAAVAHGMTSRQLRLEAVTFYPWPESHLWLTTNDHLDNVMLQVVRGLRIGEIPRPLGADFRGSRQLVGGTFRGLSRGD